jgi:hypothetical protein
MSTNAAAPRTTTCVVDDYTTFWICLRWRWSEKPGSCASAGPPVRLTARKSADLDHRPGGE